MLQGNLVYPPFIWWLENIFIALLLFAIYVEIAPGLGGIWIRPNPQGHLVPSLRGLAHYLVQPLYTSILWYPRIWDANWFVFAGAFMFVSFVFFQWKNNATSVTSSLTSLTSGNSSAMHPLSIQETES